MTAKSTDGVGGSYKVIDKAAYFNLIGYRPHPKQQLFHHSRARFRAPCCGRRFGKSKMAGTDAEPYLLLPKRRTWIIGPTYDLGEKEFRVIWDDMIVRLKFGTDKRVKRGYNKKQGSMFIEYPWGARVEVRSAEHPENLVGESLDHVIMSEAAKHRKDTFERYIRAALADRRGRADFPTTPEGFNWFHDIWRMGQDPTLPSHASWQFPSWDNPYVYPEGRNDPEIKLIERTTASEWFLQEIGADFTAFVGKIYQEWRNDIHVQPHTFNPAWPNYIAFDWGYTNPMAAVEFQISPLDTVHVWRMWYKRGMRLKDYLQMMADTPNPEGYRLDLCFGDAADPEAVQTVTEDFHPCVADPRSKSGSVQGVGQRKISGWREGINLVSSFLKIREPSDFLDMTDMVSLLDLEYADSLRRPGLTVDPSCVDLISEFNSYRSPPTVDGRTIREGAMPYPDHALDALRYGLMHIFKLYIRNHLSELYSQEDFTDLPEGGYFQTQQMRF